MAKRLTNNIITGNDPRLGMCFYYSPHFDQNIWRRASSLTGERTQKDPAFKGFRQSSSRLKQASPIAASLYKLVPARLKQFALYRTLTGEAIRMLKEEMEAAIIKEILKKKYIDPLLDTPKKTIRTRRVLLFQKIREGRSAVKYFSSTDSCLLPQTGRDVSAPLLYEPEPPNEPKPRTKTTMGLIYLGRLPECKKLKVWLRPVDSSDSGLGIH